MKNFISYLISLDKYSKAIIVAVTDSFILFFCFTVFFIFPAILLTSFSQPLNFYFQQSFSLNFFISVVFYNIGMLYFRGFFEVLRRFTLSDTYRILSSISLFLISLFSLNSFSAVNFTEVMFVLLQSFTTAASSFVLILMTRLVFNHLAKQRRKESKEILIYGLGDVAQEIYSSLSFGNEKVIGFISDNTKEVGRELLAKRIYSFNEAKKMLSKNNNIQIYLAQRSMPEIRKSEVLEECVKLGVKVKKVSSYSEMLKERDVSLVDLSISDLIPRTNLDDGNEKVSFLSGQNVLVTGAGGSIGSEISKKLALADLSVLILIDISESALFAIHNEIKELNPKCRVIPVILNIRDSEKLEDIFQKYNPTFIYHAAAYKHVPLLESDDNFMEAFKNNFLGTCNIVDIAIKHTCKRFVFVSTDKAVRPTNLMGGSKRMCELYIQSMNKLYDQSFLSSVRFGNVMDSSGSVIPIFRNQIKKGGPVTVTHPEITRYFMTISEAAYLVILSSGMNNEGTYMLKMGEPVKILDIAKRMIRLSGNEIKNNSKNNGIEIIFSGLRPGEKLYEELLVQPSDLETSHPKIFVDTNEKIFSEEKINEIRENFISKISNNDKEGLRVLLCEYADYREQDGNVN